MDKLTEDAVREIEQIHSSWIEFEVAGEGHRLMTLCADDIELLPPDAQPVLGRTVDGHFELTLDDLVDFFLRMEVLVNGRAAYEIVVRKRHALRMEIPSVPARQTLNDIEAVGINKGHKMISSRVRF
jgi:hypothetical protein